MEVIIRTTNWGEMEKLLTMLDALKVKNYSVVGKPTALTPSIIKGDKSLDPTALFGIWKDHPRNLEEIRHKSWNRKWN